MGLDVSVSQYPSGRWCLDVADADDSCDEVFEERGLQGGGYTWEGVVQALVEMRMPESLPRLDFGAEADNMHVYADEQAVLERVADLVRSAVADHRLLIAAIEHAGDDLE